jgi:hypothetical protein
MELTTPTERAFAAELIRVAIRDAAPSCGPYTWSLATPDAICDEHGRVAGRIEQRGNSGDLAQDLFGESLLFAECEFELQPLGAFERVGWRITAIINGPTNILMEGIGLSLTPDGRAWASRPDAREWAETFTLGATTVAARAGKSPRTIRQLAETHGIGGQLSDGTRVFRPSDVARFANIKLGRPRKEVPHSSSRAIR